LAGGSANSLISFRIAPGGTPRAPEPQPADARGAINRPRSIALYAAAVAEYVKPGHAGGQWLYAVRASPRNSLRIARGIYNPVKGVAPPVKASVHAGAFSCCCRAPRRSISPVAGRKHLTESEWNAVPSSAKIRRRVDLSNSGRRPRVDSRQKRVSMLVAGLLVRPFRVRADEHPYLRIAVVCLLRER
jgi:hypothetical protein